jgi:hypothetical protein
MCCLSRALAMQQRRGDRQSGVHAREHVGHRDPDLLRAAPRPIVPFPGDAHQAADGLEHEVVAGQRRFGSVLPEPGDRAIDETGARASQVLVAQSEARQVAGP